VVVADMPELERYILHRLAEVDAELKQHVNDFAFGPYMRVLNAFAQEDLSAFFFDIRKDCLYCDAPDDPKRMAYRTVMDILFHALTRYIAPVLVFTAEEIWQSRFPDEADSIHLKEWPEVDSEWLDDELYRKWDHLVDLRSQVTEAIEPLRRDKKIRSSLEAEVNIRVKDAMLADRAASIDVSELCIVASASVTGFADESIDKMFNITVTKTDNRKCGRCWRLLPEVDEDGALCDRCAEVLA